jgi:hypothetical protein
MKGAVSTENCQQSHSYCIWWRRVGGPDRFRHWVFADSIDDAVTQSRLDVTKALGTNTSLWNIEEPGDKATRGIPTDLVWREYGRSSQRVGIMAFVFLVLGLLFLFHWKSRTVAPTDSDAASGIITPEIRSEDNATVWSWDGFVQSTKGH